MTVEKFGHAARIDQDKIDALKELFPNIFTEGQLNLQELQLELADVLVPDQQEHYGLSWPGKQQAKKLAAMAPSGTLLNTPGQGVDEETTKNVIIEGDNLEVLRILKHSYSNRIKVIYIDPPYNTGGDFVYKDDFNEPVEKYLQRTLQIDDDGLLQANPTSTGRYHSNWLTMIYPRLRLARELLKEDGAIFVSIGDHEVTNLRMVMDEIFGQENFIACAIWEKNFAPKNTAQYFSENHEYVLIYAKNSDIWRPFLLPRSEEALARYGNPDNDPRGDWASSDLLASLTSGQRGKQYQRTGTSPNLYEVTSPSGKIYYPPSGNCWRVSPEKFRELDEDKRIWWGEAGGNMPRLKRFLTDVKNGVVPVTIWEYEDVGHTQEASQELKDIFSDARDSAFPTPKPTRLLERIIRLASEDENDIILDFFAGSGTTMHAAWKINVEQNINRQVILVQLPEPMTTGQYATIAEVTKERMRRVSKKFKQEALKGDFGFKVFTLGKSTFNRFKSIKGMPLDQVQHLFSVFQPIRDDAQTKDILTEIMLTEGYPLDSVVTQAKEFLDNKVYLIIHPEFSTRLLVCLDRDLLFESTVEALSHYSQDLFVCLESALDDELKVRVADQVRKAKAI